MFNDKPVDHDHLLFHAQALFPAANISVAYSPDETICIDVDGHAYLFTIGSDDDDYFFTDGETHFIIPLMDFSEDF